MSQPLSDHEHTYLREKYEQEKQAQAKYVPRFASPRPKPFPADTQLTDLSSPKHFTVKLQDHLHEAVYECGNNPQVFSDHVQNYFLQAFQTKQQQIERLRGQLAHVQQSNLKR